MKIGESEWVTFVGLVFRSGGCYIEEGMVVIFGRLRVVGIDEG